MKSVYLAGPIAGLTYQSATDWRDYAKKRLAQFGIDGRSPMRDKSHLKSETVLTDQGYEQRPLSTQKGIVCRDHYDATHCDVILMNLAGAKKASIGSMVELGWASDRQIPIVTILDLNETGNPHTHAFVKELSGFIVPTLDEALDIVISLLDGKIVDIVSDFR